MPAMAPSSAATSCGDAAPAAPPIHSRPTGPATRPRGRGRGRDRCAHGRGVCARSVRSRPSTERLVIGRAGSAVARPIAGRIDRDGRDRRPLGPRRQPGGDAPRPIRRRTRPPRAGSRYRRSSPRCPLGLRRCRSRLRRDGRADRPDPHPRLRPGPALPAMPPAGGRSRSDQRRVRHSAGPPSFAALSPDDRSIAATVGDPTSGAADAGLLVVDRASGRATVATLDGRLDGYPPAWLGDGTVAVPILDRSDTATMAVVDRATGGVVQRAGASAVRWRHRPTDSASP